jgi:pimeloyl-ACP methyl ester carboxylesterase
MTDEITPFRIDISDADRLDLQTRLRHTRWPEPESVNDWSQGIPLAFTQRLCRYWADHYDWGAARDRLNSFPQFRTLIDGIHVHFIHMRSRYPEAVPLVLTHGWPGSVVEFYKVIEPLVDPVSHGSEAADAFHVVCPSLPGYGFSDRPAEPGWGIDRIADAWVTLMERLGYQRFGAQGGDWGAEVTVNLARRYPAWLLGIHLNFVMAEFASMSDDLTPREQQAINDWIRHRQWDSGYSRQQSTRPQTLAYGLTDSPAFQCAWIAEKFWAWMDCEGDPLTVLTEDELLDNIMMYWIPATGGSSGRLYWESFREWNLDPVGVPTGCSIFPREIRKPSRRWAEKRFTDIRWWNELDRGGHFAALEQPTTFVDEVRSAFRPMR